MGLRSVSFSNGEWYHVYSRGVNKCPIYLDERDTERFLMLLYTSNSTTPIHISNIKKHQGPVLSDVLNAKRGEQMVEIGSYCLMRNHFHLLLRQTSENGISAVMQKMGTGYTMYFNKKYMRTGTLFSSRFKARHVDSDQYLRRVINYIHANPAELFEPKWKEGIVNDEPRLRKELTRYRFSSLSDYENISRPESVILSKEGVLSLVEDSPTFGGLLEDARVFYASQALSVNPY